MTPLQQAAHAVIDRWDSPLWKDQPHTSVYIAELRKALEAEQAQAVEPVAWIGDSPSRGNGKRLFWSKSEAYAYANKYEPLYTHPAPPAQQVAAPAKSEPLSPSELHLVYCNDSSAGDWHRAKENYVAGFTAAERHHGIKAKPAHTDWSAA